MEQSFVRKFGLLLICGAAGALAFALTVNSVAPPASVNLRYSRAEIMDKANSYLRGLGYDLKDYQQDAWFSLESSVHLYLQTQGGIPHANAILRTDSLPAHHWYVSWYDRSRSQSQSIESFRAWLSPSAKILGFQHVIKDTASLPSLTKAEALEKAENFLHSQGIDLSPLTLGTSSETQQSHRLDHKFVWSDKDTALERNIWVQIQGTEIGGFRQTVEEGGTFQAMMSGITTTATFIATSSYAVFFLLFFFVVVLFLKKYHEGEVGTRTGAIVFIALFAISVVGTINIYPLIGASVGMGDLNKYNTRMISFGMTVFIYHVFLSVMVFAAWSVGESSSRSVWPRKLAGIDSFLTFKPFTIDVAEGVIRGYMWGLILIGAYATILYFFLPAMKTGLFVTEGGGIAEAYLPGIRPFLSGIASALFAEIVFRLFFLSYIKEKTGKMWLSILVSVLLWAATAFVMWEIPFGSPKFVETYTVLIVYALIMNWLFLKYDLLTTICAAFLISGFDIAIPLFSSSGQYYAAFQWVCAGLFMLPLVAAVGGLIRKERFQFTPQTMPTHILRITERERMAKELEIARKVQMSLLPKMNPVTPGYDIAGICIPAQEVGGDYYDFVSLGGKRIGIALGDVSGKGVPAAIYMTLTKGILQSNAEDNVSPKTVLSKVNSLMYRTIDRNSFVSMFYAILDPQQRTIRFARAGQCPVIVAQHSGGKGSFLTPKGMALGLENGTVFDSVLEEQEVALSSGEVLVFYTDGFTEAMTETGDEFGEQRLVDSLGKHRNKPANEVIKGIVEDVNDFTRGKPQHDDMTMVVLKVG